MYMCVSDCAGTSTYPQSLTPSFSQINHLLALPNRLKSTCSASSPPTRPRDAASSGCPSSAGRLSGPPLSPCSSWWVSYLDMIIRSYSDCRKKLDARYDYIIMYSTYFVFANMHRLIIWDIQWPKNKDSCTLEKGGTCSCLYNFERLSF